MVWFPLGELPMGGICSMTPSGFLKIWRVPNILFFPIRTDTGQNFSYKLGAVRDEQYWKNYDNIL